MWLACTTVHMEVREKSVGVGCLLSSCVLGIKLSGQVPLPFEPKYQSIKIIFSASLKYIKDYESGFTVYIHKHCAL